jgi:phosphoglycolate phosphatase
MVEQKLVIFDLDGTLFRTELVDIGAFNMALEMNGYSRLSGEEILGYIGMVLEDIARTMLHTEDRALIHKFIGDVIRLEEKLITECGQLYPGVEDMLQRLKSKGFRLCICSNGNCEYVMAIAGKFGFHSIFDEIWYAKKDRSKSEAVGLLKEMFQATRFVMVGDRTSDIEAARANGGISIGAAYGFGGDEVREADHIAGNVKEVESIICLLLR